MEIVDVVKIAKMGTPGSYYVLVPMELFRRLGLNEDAEFIVSLAGKKIIYELKNQPLGKKKEAPS